MAVVRRLSLVFLVLLIVLGTVPLTAQLAQASTLPSVSIEDKWVWEGDSGEKEFYLVVRLSAPSSEDYVIVDFRTQDGTAKANTDYVPTNPDWPYNYALFEDGATVDTIHLKVKGDTQIEPNEYFYVVLYDPYRCTIADGQATVTIGNDDYPPTLSVNDVTVDPEGDSGTKDAVFTVSMSRSWSQSVTVDYSTADASAEEGADYQATSGTLTFAPGETAKTISVPVLGDMMDEYDESFFLNLSNATNATIRDSRGYGRIVDDDPQPALSVNDVVVEEGYWESFTISLSNPSGKSVFVYFKTADGTATAGADYFGWPTWGLGFDPGEATKEFWLWTYHDTIDEPDETFYINLWDPRNATIADSQGVVTIQDNDPPPTLSVSDVTVDPEGDSGTKDAEFMVSLSQVSGKTVTVDYSTADGTATSGADYQATSGTLTFAPGEIAKTIPVAVIGDMLTEFSETFSLNLSNPTNATIADGEGLGTIVDDDPIPVLIDIKPGSDPNSINLGSKGVIPVAILTTEDFDATTVDGETVRFGPGQAAPVHYAIEDVDGDGDLDIILHFKVQEADIGAEDTEAILTGQTQDSVHIIGVDAVRIVPPKATAKGNKK